MLSHIQVRNLIIVSELELDLSPGMTALTGETGAGKSILIDALSLVLGDKADPGLVRAECERAEVAVELEPTPAARAWLEAQGLDDEGPCLMRRQIARKGRSRAFINGRSATSSQLRALGELIVDVHGQHAHQSLLRAAAQRALLDGYGGLDRQVDELSSRWRRLRELQAELKSLDAEAEARRDRLALLRFQVEELDDLALSEGEPQALDHEQRRLSHLGSLQQGAAGLVELLYDAEGSVRDRIGNAARELDELGAIDKALKEPQELVEGAAVQIEEAVTTLRSYLDGLDIDPAERERVEQRLSQVHDLARKHQVLPEQLVSFHEQLRRELESLQQASESRDDLAAECDAARGAALNAAETLSSARREAAARLSSTVTEAMQGLSMKGGRFEAALQALPAEELSVNGLDRIDFLVSANPGQPLSPLAKSASGGELSRISLAIQVATAACGAVPTLIFDEVDVGIGGGVAEVVGRLLRGLGEERQVLCVTHLPQVAAQAHQQMRVSKHNRDGATFTCIEPLDASGRIEEIARMLGGEKITTKTRAHAAEMLSAGTRRRAKKKTASER